MGIWHIRYSNKTFLIVSLVFFDSEQLLIYKQTPKNASKYPKLACAKIAILHPADFRGLKMCKNQIFLTRSKHRSYHKYGIGIYIEFHQKTTGGGVQSAPPPR